jgi:hypothetical protein
MNDHKATVICGMKGIQPTHAAKKYKVASYG